MLYFILFIGINIFIAWWNDQLRRKAIKLKKDDAIDHPLWAALYIVLCASPYIPLKNIWLCLSLLPQHLSVFPVAFNRYSDLPAFHLSKTSKAMTDRFMVWIGLKDTAAVNIASLLASVCLFIVYKIHK